MSYEVHMMGNNFELLDCIRIVRITGGGLFGIDHPILLFVWKSLSWNDDPLLQIQQQKASAKSEEIFADAFTEGEAGAGEDVAEKADFIWWTRCGMWQGSNLQIFCLLKFFSCFFFLFF